VAISLEGDDPTREMIAEVGADPSQNGSFLAKRFIVVKNAVARLHHHAAIAQITG